MKEGCEICRPWNYAAAGGHLVWLCNPAGLVYYLIAIMVEEIQYEMLIYIVVTFNVLSSDSYVLFVHWCFIVAAGFFICWNINFHVCLKSMKERRAAAWKLRNNKAIPYFYM
jgi:hypothetical protein